MLESSYDSHTALAKIREILSSDGGYLLVRDHCYDRQEEKNVDDILIRRILQNTGEIGRKPEWDKKHQKFKYTVEGFDEEGDKLYIVVNIVEEYWRVVAVTVFWTLKGEK